MTGLWYWGPSPYILKLLPGNGIELAPARRSGRSTRFRAAPDGGWIGLDGYYAGERLRVVRAADGTPEHLDLGTFIFVRAPYQPGGALAARPAPDGWGAG